MRVTHEPQNQGFSLAVLWILSLGLCVFVSHCSLLVLPERLEKSDAGTPDGSTPDGSTPDGSTPDGSTPDGSTPDGSTPDGPATKLLFLKQPANITLGSFFNPTIEIGAVTDKGAIDPKYTGEITLEAVGQDIQIFGPKTVLMENGQVRWPAITVLPGGTVDVTLLAHTNGLISAQSSAFAITGSARYVDGGAGNDQSNACTNYRRPCATIAKATAAAGCGEIIFIQGGTYRTPIHIDRTCDNTLVFRPWPATQDLNIDTRATPGPSITMQGKGLRLERFHIIGSQEDGIHIRKPANNISIWSCELRDLPGKGIAISDGTDHLIESSTISSTLGIGIEVRTTTNTRIINNYVSAVQASGIRTEHSVANSEIKGNNVDGNDVGIFLTSPSEVSNNRIHNNRVGISIGGGNGSQIANNTINNQTEFGIVMFIEGISTPVRNNIITNNQKGGINDWFGRADGLAFNLFYNNASNNCMNLPASACEHGQQGNIAGIDPMFVDTEAYYLSSPAGHFPFTNINPNDPKSPAIDAADPDDDFLQEPQPNGSHRNLGAWGNTQRASKTPDGPG